MQLCVNINAGFTHILTMDLHQKEVQGFFNCPIDNLRAANFLIEFITHSVSLMTFISNSNTVCCCLSKADQRMKLSIVRLFIFSCRFAKYKELPAENIKIFSFSWCCINDF